MWSEADPLIPAPAAAIRTSCPRSHITSQHLEVTRMNVSYSGGSAAISSAHHAAKMLLSAEPTLFVCLLNILDEDLYRDLYLNARHTAPGMIQCQPNMMASYPALGYLLFLSCVTCLPGNI